MVISIDDLQLAWPRDLFIRELRAVEALGTPNRSKAADHYPQIATTFTQRHEFLDLLFTEAFSGRSGSEWLASAQASGRLDALIAEIFADPSRITPHPPRVLYRDRHGRGASPSNIPKLTFVSLRNKIGELLKELDADGYFDSALGTNCVDSDNDHAGRGRDELSTLMGSEEVWPPDLGISDEDHTYTVVEAVFHLLARPRLRSFHSYGQEWHYSYFDSRAGQAVYRWRVNALLEQSDSLLRLDETGILVETTGDPRDELLDTMAHDAQAPSPDTLRHAIDQYRRRGATREDKRAAVIALAGILETNRKLLKDELVNKDEGALFHIANEFAIRHQGAGQRPDYPDAYLDWIFWWYLATVALVKTLLERQTTDPERP
jgi:hypothetical protein